MEDVIVLYCYQGELGESFDIPNAFFIRKENKRVTYADFVAEFPIKTNDQLHFRFKTSDSSHGFVWTEGLKPDEPIPFFQGIIVVKVLNLNDAKALKRKSRLKLKQPNTTNTAQKFDIQEVTPKKVSSTEKLTNIESSNSQPPKPQRPVSSETPKTTTKSTSSTTSAPRVASPTADLLNTDDDTTTVDNTTADLLFTSSSSSTTSAATTTATTANNTTPISTIEKDLFEFDDVLQPLPTTISSQQSKNASIKFSSSNISVDIDESGPLPSRAELKNKRENLIDENVQKALENKQEMDELQRKETEEFEIAKSKWDPVLTQWAFNNKEKRNIRTLLSTMHTVLWSGHTWKPIGLGDVLADKQVKLQYRKAMLVVHPDRCSGSGYTAEMRFIAKRVFEAVNEAYQEFLIKEGISS